MATSQRSTRVIGNPADRAFGRPAKSKRSHAKKKSGAHKAARRNFGQIVGFTLANTGRKANNKMAATKKKHTKKKPGHAKHNTGHLAHKGDHRRAKSNPGMMGGVGPLVTNAVFVIVGALGSKLGAQMILGSNNVGMVGYATNAAVGGGLWFLTEKVMKNRAASAGIIAGTVVQIILRLINDFTPFGQYVAQLGMGDYQMQSFVTPQVLVDPLNSAEIAIPPAWQPPALPAPSAAGTGVVPAGTPMSSGGVGGLYGGSWGTLYG